jgi:predicted Zn-ribbon and HTH transcriptional regulator
MRGCHMPGIPAKCLECGSDLRYDPVRLLHTCPACEGKGEVRAGAEVKRAA